jgi:hypothetical protein
LADPAITMLLQRLRYADRLARNASLCFITRLAAHRLNIRGDAVRAGLSRQCSDIGRCDLPCDAQSRRVTAARLCACRRQSTTVARSNKIHRSSWRRKTKPKMTREFASLMLLNEKAKA